MQRKPANEFLAEFYKEMGIRPGDMEDLPGKQHALDGKVVVPYYPAGKKPALWQLELQLLRENGYMV
ncbi:MAG: hypothetical protein NTY20_02405 [Candidatus Aenigmarchaeota archaeon]|nr:hypothetical protein [Candidatus Aenigmarchaeota archaeon]